MKNDCLYSACMRFPQVTGEVVFKYSKMEIIKHYPDMVELKYPYFTSYNCSTRYFDENMLDKEYKISDSFICYYSADKQKCIDWLTEKRNDLLKIYKYDYERLLKSKIKEDLRDEYFN